MSDLNDSQQRIVDTTEGIVVVDAGPGTGKTATVTERCIRILQKNIEGKDVIMMTFTNNAAEEMRQRIAKKIAEKKAEQERIIDTLDKKDIVDYDLILRKSREMMVCTFDSFCMTVLSQYPAPASKELGLSSVLSHHASVSTNDALNHLYFCKFLNEYLAENDLGEFAPIFSSDPKSLQAIIERLLSICVIPTKNIWFWRDGILVDDDGGKTEIDHLSGCRELLRDELLKKDLSYLRKNVDTLPPEYRKSDDKDAPAEDETYVKSSLVENALTDSQQKKLIDAIHDLMFAYIDRCVKDNHLTFSLIKCLALVTLYKLRTPDSDSIYDEIQSESFKFKYVTVDEFQDTNPADMSITLMILDLYKDSYNLCVVGDWKQGIYEFRNTDIRNLMFFDHNVQQILYHLKKAIKHPSLLETCGNKLPLDINYRSSSLIIRCSFHSLIIDCGENKHTYEEADIHKIVASDANTVLEENTSFERIQCNNKDEQIRAVLSSVMGYVRGGKYQVWGADKDGNMVLRKPEYSDIAVLCRTNPECRAVKTACDEFGIPSYINGDQEVMNTPEAKMLLAWLRFVENQADPVGYIPIMAAMGISAYDIRTKYRPSKKTGGALPDQIVRIRKDLVKKKSRIINLVSSIFAVCGYDNDITQTILSEIASMHRNNLLTISDIIKIIEYDIDEESDYNVDSIPEDNVITIQTLHKSKGLEYPIVIIPYVNKKGSKFPLNQGDRINYVLNDLAGLRCKKIVEGDGNNFWNLENWRTYVANKYKPDSYNEERRLLFVGISRAKQYVTMIAHEPSDFFTDFDSVEGTEPILTFDPKAKIPNPKDENRKKTVEKPVIPPYKPRRIGISVHDILCFGECEPSEDSCNVRFSEDDRSSKGMERGIEVHLRAQRLSEGGSVAADDYLDYPELKNVEAVLANLPDTDPGLRKSEIPCFLPIATEKHSNRKVTLRGIIDMLYVDRDVIEIHDWKTDVSDRFREEYMVQLSIYAYAAKGFFEMQSGKERKITCVIDWLNPKNPAFPRTEFEPVPMERIISRVDDYLDFKDLDSSTVEEEYLDDDSD
ncbi:ATP-dependent exoDNAse (exonuclease V) beta subunit (contains helicase and exonuclease domains) [Thermoplasmatales archaeon BRNA1]|nr:ATP-dependent exoDNAse (exonuclease V) beta subunit (contains helicase and exonuclease domains) [Thermoplasmatales archaeon BRNA1]